MKTVKLITNEQKEIYVNQNMVTKYLVKYLREPNKQSSLITNYGYDVYLGNVIPIFLKNELKIIALNEADINSQNAKTVSPLFLDAIWDLCRLGILRPSTADIGGQGSPNNAGYSITSFGQQWLQEFNMNDYVPTEPDLFAELLAPFIKTFGPSFQERAQESIRCFNAHAYLACCAMVGAATETIIYTIADKLQLSYSKKECLSNIKNKIISNSKKGIQDKLLSYTENVKYWRDESMHTQQYKISATHAYESIQLLLIASQYAKETWFKE